LRTKGEQTETDKRRMRRKFAKMERIAVDVSEGNDSDLALLITRLSERQLAQSLLPESEKKPITRTTAAKYRLRFAII
jgi:hypothetical protein